MELSVCLRPLCSENGLFSKRCGGFDQRGGKFSFVLYNLCILYMSTKCIYWVNVAFILFYKDQILLRMLLPILRVLVGPSEEGFNDWVQQEFERELIPTPPSSPEPSVNLCCSEQLPSEEAMSAVPQEEPVSESVGFFFFFFLTCLLY